MPRLSSVFDTNVYRSVGRARFDALRRREANHSVIGFATYATVTELLAHLASPESTEGRAAAAAAERLLQHCTEYDGSFNVIRFVAPPLGQISRYLFGKAPDEADLADGYGRLLGQWVTVPAARPELAARLNAIAEHAELARSHYVDTLWRTVVLTLAPQAQSWADITSDTTLRTALAAAVASGEGKRLLALTLARQAAAEVSYNIRPEDEERIVAHVLANFGLVLEYRHRIIANLIANGPNMAKRSRANGVFDVHVCGATAALARLRGVPVVLVTDDDDILNAAADVSMRDEVITLEEYEALLDFDSPAFRQRIDAASSRQDARMRHLGNAV